MPGLLISGGADGIGLATALTFLQAGYAVHICDANEDSVAKVLRQHPAVRATAADVGRPEDVKRVVAEARAWLPSIDALVNNVGVAGPRGAVEEIPWLAWNEVFQVNLFAMVEFMRGVVPLMKERRSGAIVNVSTASVRTLPVMRSIYNVSKAAVEALTLCAARELGPFHIRCNAIRPGLVDNARLAGVINRIATDGGRTFAAVESGMLRGVSMQTKVQMSDVSEATLFLCSDAARHITGQVLSVCGDLHSEI